ncbi:HupE/UreJ family protein [Synechococcus elongatus IITB4]|uniref:HupE/UreJ family protein n=1 Tax=Synechococcus elongatus TaxID=32046 RepID=UPI0030D52233
MQIQSGQPLYSIQRSLQRFSLLSAPILLVLSASPAFAHHAIGGETPTTVFEGLLAGLAHPVIGIDHFAFVIAVGLLASVTRQGLFSIAAFIAAALLGTVLHLASLDLPGVELLISASILLFGWLLACKSILPTWAIVGLAAIAGIFHGYAYGEAIIGAGMAPLFSYLIGFSLTQLVIAVAAWSVGRALINQSSETAITTSPLKTTGLILVGVGLSFLASELINLVLPQVA